MSETKQDKELTEAEEAFESINVDKLTELFIAKQESFNNLEDGPDKITPDTISEMHDSSTFPEQPIAPSILAHKVSEKLAEFGNIVPDKTPIMVEELCRSFNECIRLNTNGEKAQTLILSPKTGSAKSVSSKMYVSLLESHASIIVVYGIKDAIDTCRDINEWNGDNYYARCYYANDDKNPLRVEKDKLNKYRCIVVSHELFKRANVLEGIEYLSLYNKKPREFVLIDERINLHKTFTFPLIHLEKLTEIFEKIQGSLELGHLKHEIEFLKSTAERFEDLKKLTEITIGVDKGKATKKMEDKKFIPVHAELYHEFGFSTFDFKNFYNLLKAKKIDLQKILDPMSLIGNTDFNEKIKSNLTKQLNILSTILKYRFYYFQYSSIENSPVIMVTKNIINTFGSSVVLDATATVNQIYVDKVIENPDTVKHIKTTNPRRYNNLTIHQCSGIPQGKGSIYRALSEKELKNSVYIYSNLAKSLLTSEDDKLLIITHKDFRVKLEEELTDEVKNEIIKFTHWGNHRGKNEWNNCNKVLVIGWLQLPAEVHYENYINAIGGLDYLSNDTFTEMKKYYTITQIADDLVQGVNRATVRNTVSEEGDCGKCDVYMFYPDEGYFASNVLDQFQTEFDGVNIKSWKPKEVSDLLELSKVYVKIETIVNYIHSRVLENGEVTQPSVQKYFDVIDHVERLRDSIDRIPKTTFSKYVDKHDEFTILLKSKGIKRVPINSKSYKFTTV